jgi:rhamnogalacturonyl hydrolase YesR
MFAYALLKAIRLGIVDTETYKPVAVKLLKVCLKTL